MTTDENDTLVDEAVIEGLRPQSRRYDVAVDNELVIAILPNGAKTWTWVHEGPGKPHRQTLGIYPEMSLDDARVAVSAAAAALERTGERDHPAEFVIKGGKIQRAHADWKIPVAGAFIVFAAGALFSWLLLRGGDETAQAATETGYRAPSNSGAASVSAATPGGLRDQDSNNRPAPVVATTSAATIPASLKPDKALSTQVAVAEVVSAGDDSLPAEIAPAINQARQVVEEALSAPLADLMNKSDKSPQIRTQERPTPPPVDQAGASTSLSGSVVARAETRDDAGPAQTANPTRNNAYATVANPDDPRVARAQLTSAVLEREPVDELGPAVLGNGEPIQTFYFFTELRGLSGERVRHRWVYDGQALGDVSFNVGDAWRWRVYSSKRLLASQAGLWRIEVLLDDDTSIYALPFSYEP